MQGTIPAHSYHNSMGPGGFEVATYRSDQYSDGSSLGLNTHHSGRHETFLEPQRAPMKEGRKENDFAVIACQEGRSSSEIRSPRSSLSAAISIARTICADFGIGKPCSLQLFNCSKSLRYTPVKACSLNLINEKSLYLSNTTKSILIQIPKNSRIARSLL